MDAVIFDITHRAPFHRAVRRRLDIDPIYPAGDRAPPHHGVVDRIDIDGHRIRTLIHDEVLDRRTSGGTAKEETTVDDRVPFAPEGEAFVHRYILVIGACVDGDDVAGGGAVDRVLDARAGVDRHFGCGRRRGGEREGEQDDADAEEKRVSGYSVCELVEIDRIIRDDYLLETEK